MKLFRLLIVVDGRVVAVQLSTGVFELICILCRVNLRKVCVCVCAGRHLSPMITVYSFYMLKKHEYCSLLLNTNV